LFEGEIDDEMEQRDKLIMEKDKENFEMGTYPYDEEKESN